MIELKRADQIEAETINIKDRKVPMMIEGVSTAKLLKSQGLKAGAVLGHEKRKAGNVLLL